METGEHLIQCIVFIDLNMVRTGTINHPSQWYWCGYNEIQNPRRKNVLIDYEKLMELAGYNTFDIFQTAHRKWVDDSLTSCENKRESQWTEGIAMGNKNFVKRIISQLGSRAKGRKILEVGQGFQIREERESYNALFDDEKCDIAPENAYNWRSVD